MHNHKFRPHLCATTPAGSIRATERMGPSWGLLEFVAIVGGGLALYGPHQSRPEKGYSSYSPDKIF
jgi:hypothetical protein